MRAEFVKEAPDVQQAAVICFRIKGRGKLQVMLVGSLRNGRWGLPKGHLEAGEQSFAAAGREAFEEAGVSGELSKEVFGTYSYSKDSTGLRYHVSVHILRLVSRAKDFPESGMTKTQWFSIGRAINLVAQPGLKIILERFQNCYAEDLAVGNNA
ncbi:NUDIX hydrolase [Rhizobium sp. 11_C7_N12_5]|jgi:8-oxo-dGTP pyrophosphatase MutT (NUDIX family)|uniref:NUDIX hydrolase n=1 Tax=Rhizobium sp. 11_C7_N12_5 TaxID=3240770 RepID=UPI003F209737